MPITPSIAMMTTMATSRCAVSCPFVIGKVLSAED
jgi:hypothetical protein